MSGAKKLQRGLSTELMEALQDNAELLELIKQKDYLMCIRNNYFNIYYKGLSLGKFYLVNQQWKVEVSRKYLAREGHVASSGTERLDLPAYLKCHRINREAIQSQIKKYAKDERICQQQIINNNNANPCSDYFCVDMEYIMHRESNKDENYGRFDIIAIAKKPNQEGIHQVALIELKLGTGAMGGIPEKLRQHYEVGQKVNLKEYGYNLGSGFLGHIASYVGYLEVSNTYSKLKSEMVDMISQFKQLGLINDEYFKELTVSKLAVQPEIIFLTYTEPDKLDEAIETARRYLFNDPEKCFKYNVEAVTEYDVRQVLTINNKQYKFKFYFREWTEDNTRAILTKSDKDMFV